MSMISDRWTCYFDGKKFRSPGKRQRYLFKQINFWDQETERIRELYNETGFYPDPAVKGRLCMEYDHALKQFNHYEDAAKRLQARKLLQIPE